MKIHKRLTLLAMLCFCINGCVVVTIKENHTHIHDNEGTVQSEGKNTGSEADGNNVAPSVDIPLIP